MQIGAFGHPGNDRDGRARNEPRGASWADERVELAVGRQFR